MLVPVDRASTLHAGSRRSGTSVWRGGQATEIGRLDFLALNQAVGGNTVVGGVSLRL